MLGSAFGCLLSGFQSGGQSKCDSLFLTSLKRSPKLEYATIDLKNHLNASPPASIDHTKQSWYFSNTSSALTLKRQAQSFFKLIYVFCIILLKRTKLLIYRQMNHSNEILSAKISTPLHLQTPDAFIRFLLHKVSVTELQKEFLQVNMVKHYCITRFKRVFEF
ncbi:Hypothetical_protein [Hexamita inflata]|uniref:Hypothetical_protein n=1 Tax=Hexamita inflata TaxID=28002 RepID=A0AA86NCR9_9EUKA|nr:Hypothetical protein HINF_LOCUS4448 [Hexamita inflata]